MDWALEREIQLSSATFHGEVGVEVRVPMTLGDTSVEVDLPEWDSDWLSLF